ncbi:unnamed protein product [Vicia faba]|uniref:Uncharacterized protein n=1 Tax=Vicia faba TaxID=3906 RepID=A0AAV1AS70_VICFA|nr:unnamed protein product [Vicia faba]
MASITPLQTILPTVTISNNTKLSFGGSTSLSCNKIHNNHKNKNRSSSIVVSAVGDVSSDGTIFLVAGAIGIALVGTAFPIIFSRKDTCPECDGAGFVRKSGVTLRANAARKDQTQIVCARCDGLGKLNQVDK